jgi:hypothetical protein
MPSGVIDYKYKECQNRPRLPHLNVKVSCWRLFNSNQWWLGLKANKGAGSSSGLLYFWSEFVHGPVLSLDISISDYL